MLHAHVASRPFFFFFVSPPGCEALKRDAEIENVSALLEILEIYSSLFHSAPQLAANLQGHHRHRDFNTV